MHNNYVWFFFVLRYACTRSTFTQKCEENTKKLHVIIFFTIELTESLGQVHVSENDEH